MRGATITLCLLGYVAAFGLTFGYHWNRHYGQTAAFDAVIVGLVWPIYWPCIAGIQLTKAD